MKNLIKTISGKSRKKVPIREFAIACLLAVLFLLVSALFALLYAAERREPKAHAETPRQQETPDIAAKAGKLIELPQDETPTIATVTDPEKLQSQAFFKNAAAGDKVLIYGKAKLAVIYRPSTDTIIQLAPLTK